jgi:hypothetical protein
VSVSIYYLENIQNNLDLICCYWIKIQKSFAHFILMCISQTEEIAHNRGSCEDYHKKKLKRIKLQDCEQDSAGQI